MRHLGRQEAFEPGGRGDRVVADVFGTDQVIDVQLGQPVSVLRRDSSVSLLAALPFELIRENRRHLLAQFRALLAGGQPDDAPIDAEVGVYQDVPERHYHGPRDLGMAGPELLSHARRGFPDNREFPHNSAAHQFLGAEAGIAVAGDEVSDVLCRFDNVAQIQLFTPHRRAALLRARNGGSGA